MEDHIHRAVNWDWKNLECLHPRQKYRLSGVGYRSSFPDVTKMDSNIYLPLPGLTHKLHPELSVYTVYFPFPQSISLLRKVYCAENLPITNTLTVNKLSLCQ